MGIQPKGPSLQLVGEVGQKKKKKLCIIIITYLFSYPKVFGLITRRPEMRSRILKQTLPDERLAQQELNVLLCPILGW